ncbi:uncharacterized protein [Epargyreus clarus]|uniref:uncharacterized protein n=1 Tax=Epargyreus clarus TaxID=520877 RepID=UPI003C2CAABA
MGLVFVLVLTLVGVAWGQKQFLPPAAVAMVPDKVEPADNGLDNTDLILSFVIFRHGDRTPDPEELDKLPSEHLGNEIFFPFGKKALTNIGKQRGYRVGEFIRWHYDNFLSRLYLPDEINIRTTDYARTKMTALTALSAIYQPPPAQRWNPILNWQPVPYSTLPPKEDDLLYWYYCPLYMKLKNEAYDLPDVKKWIKPYESLFKYLSAKTEANITNTEDVFYLDNLFQTLENVGVSPPEWAEEVMEKIKEVTKIEYAVQFYNSDMIRLASGVLLSDILNATDAAIAGNLDWQPKVRLYSAHENNVAGFLAAAKVFIPHQPKYGSTAMLELRRRRLTGQYGITMVYSPEAGGPGMILPVVGCGGQPLCDYDTFVKLTQDYVLPRKDFSRECEVSTHHICTCDVPCGGACNLFSFSDIQAADLLINTMVHLTSIICVKKEGGREEEPTNAAEVAEVEPSMRTEHTCCCLGVLVGVSLIAALVAVILTKDTTVEVTILRQVHVLMSHGERTPSERELAMLGAPPPDHVFAPYGAGALTNEGKMLTYEMGALLRKRYNDFLGPYYEEDKSIVITSDTDLSKMTALLIAAGLWPPMPEQTWNETMNWQPVGYTYPPREDDYLLYEENCPRYNQEKQRILTAFTEEGLLLPYRDLFHKIAQMTSTNFSTPQEAYYLNNLFIIQDDIKVANPKWAKHVKRKLMDVARLEYTMMFHNNLLRKLSGGALLQQIIKEALSSTVSQEPSPSVIVRIGTPVSVAALLAACVAPPPRLPDPGAALLFELHERQPTPQGNKEQSALAHGQRFGFKIYYWDDDSAEPRLMEVPGCNALCPIDTFKEITKYIVSYNYEKDCQLVPTT